MYKACKILLPGIITVIFFRLDLYAQTGPGVINHPIELSTFSLSAKETGNALTWTSSDETDGNYFEIERSDDGINFSMIGTLKAMGGRQIGKTYNYTDSKPGAGVKYYRLKMIDNDGASVYSMVIRAGSDGHLAEIKIAPNPVKDRFTITGLTGDDSRIRIHDANGRLVKQFITSGSIWSSDLQYQPKGVYQVTIQHAKTISVKALLKE